MRSPVSPNYVLAALARGGMWLVSTPATLLMLTFPLAIVLGWLAARRGLLDAPADHRRTLARIAVWGILIGAVGALPDALVFAGVLPLPEMIAWAFSGVNAVTGVAGGIGYAALFGLLALRIGSAPGVIGRAVAGIGRRSLTFYLFQSVIFAPLLTAWGFGLGQHIGTTSAFAIAVGCGSCRSSSPSFSTHRTGAVPPRSSAPPHLRQGRPDEVKAVLTEVRKGTEVRVRACRPGASTPAASRRPTEHSQRRRVSANRPHPRMEGAGLHSLEGMPHVRFQRLGGSEAQRRRGLRFSGPLPGCRDAAVHRCRSGAGGRSSSPDPSRPRATARSSRADGPRRTAR